MRILITGNLGYVGGWLVSSLREKYPNAFISGYDLGYFQNCLTTNNFAPETKLDVQYYGDVRNFDENLLNNIDHVIHLAAISNDPIGNKFEQVTLDVNYKASVDIAEKAIKKGVKSFVFASSCSVYGAGGDAIKTESSALDPLTPYAKSKVLTEEALSKLNGGETTITCLRFATACGISDRLRLDLVLNDFVASALTSKRIDILSDGTPWRPLINIKDMARAIDWAIGREIKNGGKFLICNTGSNIWNYTVKELAEYVSQRLDNVSMSVNKDAPADKRSYRVNFDLFNSLAPEHTPQMDVVTTIDELTDGLNAIDFNDLEFRKSNLMRLNVLNGFLVEEKLNSKLRWNR
jgi:nucleoside-diphosphate-sugar epimerase